MALTPIPMNVKVVRVPAGKHGSRKSLKALQREEERACELGYSGRVEMIKALRDNNRKLQNY